MFNLGRRWKLIMVYVCAIIFSLSGFAVAEPLHEAAKEGDLEKAKALFSCVPHKSVFLADDSLDIGAYIGFRLRFRPVNLNLLHHRWVQLSHQHLLPQQRWKL